MKKWMAPLLLTLGVSVANATTVTSQVLDVRVNPSATAGFARVSILMADHTNCSVDGWFAFEFPDSGNGAAVGKVWVQEALSALTNGRQLTIFGTGACDGFQVEKVNAIDAL